MNNVESFHKPRILMTMDASSIRKAYARYARSYDLCFGRVLAHGRKEAVRRMRCRPGESVLEVGVGTGLSLPLYPRSVQIVGIDLSPEMLVRAMEVRERQNLKNVTDLLEMDAERMDFPDDRFDKVVAMYVASVVQDPVRLVDEMKRVCRPGGEIFIVNHFQQAGKVIGTIEKLLAPFASFLGWDPLFNLESFVHRTHLVVTEKIPVNCFGYWTMLKAANTKAAGDEAGGGRPVQEKIAVGFYSSHTSG